MPCSRPKMFLRQFQAVDLVTKTPMYLPDFTLTKPGLQRRWPRQPHHLRWRRGAAAAIRWTRSISSSMRRLSTTTADKTNAVAAALTVMFRTSGPVASPSSSSCTATKSHAGKDTAICFAAGTHRSVSISYQPCVLDHTTPVSGLNFTAPTKLRSTASPQVGTKSRLSGECQRRSK